MFDRVTLSDILDRPVKFRIVRDMPFEDVPFDTRRVILAQAAQRFQQLYGGDAQLDAFAKQELIDAISSQADAEADIEDYNLLGSPDVMGGLARFTFRGAAYGSNPAINSSAVAPAGFPIQPDLDATYDTDGSLSSFVLEGITYHLTYATVAGHKVPVQKSGGGRVTTYVYDAQGHLLTRTTI
jgi:Tail tubular protein